MLDRSGQIAEHKKAEVFGLPTEYMMKRPDQIVFIDEVGSSTSTTRGGNVSGQPQTKAATKDSHFTLMEFTAATPDEEPNLLCAIIFEAMNVSELGAQI